MNPGSAAAGYKLGLVLLNRGDAAAALNELRRANQLQPNMPETLLELGKASATTGDTAAAEHLFLQVLEQEQHSTLADSSHFQLHPLYKKLRRTADSDLEVNR